MAEKIKIDLEVIDNLPTSIANLKELKRQLKEVEVGTEAYDKVKQKMYDMEDAIKSANTGASNFAEIVGGLPGPVGELGDKIAGSANVLKQFGSIKLDSLKNSFSELGKDIGDGVKGLGQLTGITKLYETSVAGLTRAMTFLGVSEEGAALAARGLSAALIATGIGALIVGVGYLAANWDKVTKALNKVTEEQEAYNNVSKKTAEIGSEQIVTLEKIGNLIQSGKADQYQKNEAVNQYNKVLGDTLGKVDSWIQLEDKLKGKLPAYKEYLKQKSIADAAYQLSIDVMKKKIELAALPPEEAATKWNSFIELLGSFAEGTDYSETIKVAGQVNINEQTKQLTNLGENYDKIYEKAKGKADELAKTLGIKPQEITTGNKTTGETPAEKAARLKKEAQAVQDELDKYAEEVYKKTLDARNKELYEAGKNYNKLRIEAIAHGKDIKGITEAYLEDQRIINKKYDDIDAKTKQDRLDKEKEFWKNAKKAADEKREKEREDKLKEDAKIKGDEDAKYARLAAGAANDLDLQRQLLEAKKLADEEYYRTQLANEKLTAEDIRQLNADKLADQISYTEKSNEIEKNRIAVKQKALDDIISIAGAESDVGKAALVAKQILNAKELVMEITKTITFSTQAAARSLVAVAEGTAQTAKVGFPQNIPLLIGYAAQAVGIISAIMSAVNSAKSSATSGTVSTSTPNIPKPSNTLSIPSMETPQINSPTSASPGSQLAQTLAMSSGKPIKAYVVSSDISSQQALDRKANKGATFAMGS